MEFPNIPEFLIDPISLDYETSGLHYWAPDFQVYGFSLALPDASWYFDMLNNPNEAQNMVRWLQRIMKDRLVIAQNAQYDYQCTRVLGIDPRQSKWYCTMITECLINEHHLKYDLYSICGYNGVESRKKICLDALQQAMNMKSHQAVMENFNLAPPELAADYATSDAIDAYRVFQQQQKGIELQQLEQVHELEMDLLPVLADMSYVGVRVNIQGAQDAIPKLDEQEGILQKEVDELAGGKFNVNSSPQIRAFFKPEPVNKFQWRLIDGTIVGPTKSGKGPCLDQNALREIKHPIAEKILALRKTIKLRDTFLRGHILASADGHGYVHTTFNQTRTDSDAGTVSGRLSSVDPALQQITKRDKINAAILRSLFLADDGQLWLCEDYKQVDFRCAAHLQNDPNVIQAYSDDPELDYHQVVSDMTGIPRNPAYAGAPNTKQINLGLSFGAGEGKLAFMMGMPYQISERRGKMIYIGGDEAKEIFNLYHLRLPATKKFMKHAETVARETGYVRTQIGRRLRFPRGMGAHKAAGLLYQAYAADLHKIGLIEVDALIRRERMPARLMLSVHDEIGVSSYRDDEIKDKIREAYTNFSSPTSRVKMRVPILASGEFGDNWYEASK